MSNSVLARWDWPEARKEGLAPDEGELLPPIPQRSGVPVPEPSSEDSHLAPLDERERPTVLAAREQRLWEQLQAYDWSHRGRMSYARARRGAAAFEAKMVGIFTAQGELRLAKDSERASRVYRDRAELSRGDREVRLTLLRLWAQTVCALYRWPLPTFQSAEPPSGSSNSNGSGWRGGNPGEPGSVFTIELKSEAGGDDGDAAWDLPSELVPEPPLPPLPPFEFDTDTPDEPAHSLKPLEAVALQETGGKLDIPAAVMPAHSDPSPVEEAVKAPRPAKKGTPKAGRFGSGVRHARVSIQWFPLVMGVMMLGQTACQHVPATPFQNDSASPVQYPIDLELMGPSYLPYSCARLAVECFPPLMERGTAIQLTKYCRNEGYTIEHCLW